ncbi:hypothetical protein EWE74_07265 [Sphingobacterium corticibacterium]|uniref:Uncharacterized protein n=1 Tax=Sphingobacterium corticibacterium TaxID=2484746 RepID=A0A4Q6XS43_9SPHI|nr:hypothetical protein EWE74_07265 [Sphingobacterium corticibacterium]
MVNAALSEKGIFRHGYNDRLLLQFGVLNKQQIDLILSKPQALELKKDEYFSEAGKVPKHLGFVLEYKI